MSHQELCAQAATALEAEAGAARKKVLVGFDGFIDSIIDIVDKRLSNEEYERIPTIAAYGERISGVAGRSTNLERVVKVRKLGGNGPIMSNALLGHGIDLTYVGIIGGDTVESVFQEMADQSTRVINMGPACATDAYEFDDGKIMMTLSQPLEEVKYERLVELLGEDGLRDAFSGLHGMAMVNWTQTLAMTDIWKHLSAHVFPNLYSVDEQPYLFVDLADPAKRTEEDLLEAIHVLKALNDHVNIVLGMNEEEGRQVLEALGGTWKNDLDELARAEDCAREVQRLTGFSNVVTHFVKVAACASAAGSDAADGFFTAKPKLTTGAGDNFNAGYFMGLLLGLQPIDCLMCGTATSGYYVRNARSPQAAELVEFLQQWASGKGE